MKTLRKCLILAHRYLGIAISLLVVMWFASGIVMMYAGGMPRLTPELRLSRLPALDLQRVRLSPAAAAEAASVPGRPGGGRVQLSTIMDRPAYRVGSTIVFADNGERLDGVSLAQALTIAARFAGVAEERVSHAETLTDIDQWTLGQARSLPLHRFEVADGEGTQLYVQHRTGEVVQRTTRRGRALAWIGTIPHWLYFTALRENQPLWYQIVVWGSGAACVLAVLGLLLSVTQFRKTRPFRLVKAIPYAGLTRWHYITGAVFGVFTLTWAFSGLLSMEPFEWTNARGLEVGRDAMTGGPVQLSQFSSMDAASWDRTLGGRRIKEIEFTRIQDDHYYVVRLAPEHGGAERPAERLHQPYYITGRAESDRVLVKADTMEVRQGPFSEASLLARLRAAEPDTPVEQAEMLTDYDSYYYSRARQSPLPVLRVKFADPMQTWVYVDPEMSQVLAQIHRLNRVERWLYNGLHSLDFSFWYNRRPLWDIGMLTLLLGGLSTSVFGLVLGVKRLRRGAVRSWKTVTPSESGAEPAAVGVPPATGM